MFAGIAPRDEMDHDATDGPRRVFLDLVAARPIE
jgi:hypothetical protein